MVAEEKNRLHREKSRKRESRQGRGVSLLGNDDDDDIEDAENNDEDLLSLVTLQGSGNDARLSGACCSTGASDDGATQKSPPLSLP